MWGGHQLWLKVERTKWVQTDKDPALLPGEVKPDQIGLYLCCGDDEPRSRFPFSVDYKLMARKPNTDLGVLPSDLFRTDFGKEKAWGLSRFATADEIARCCTGGKVTFGCMVWPVRNLRWGRVVELRPEKKDERKV